MTRYREFRFIHIVKTSCGRLLLPSSIDRKQLCAWYRKHYSTAVGLNLLAISWLTFQACERFRNWQWNPDWAKANDIPMHHTQYSSCSLRARQTRSRAPNQAWVEPFAGDGLELPALSVHWLQLPFLLLLTDAHDAHGCQRRLIDLHLWGEHVHGRALIASKIRWWILTQLKPNQK